MLVAYAVLAAPRIRNGLPVVGAALTFWKAPVRTMAGLIGIEVAPAARSEVTTNCARLPVVLRVCGLTAKQPGKSQQYRA